MATVTLSKPYNFQTTKDWSVSSATQVVITSSKVTITEGSQKQEFFGEFGVSGENLTGTGTSTKFYLSGQLVYTATGLNLDAGIMQDHTYTANDAQATNAYVFRGNDVITGSTGSDTLLGYAGNDLINGGAGKDVLYGGGGADKFRFNSTLNASTNVDVVKDFSTTSDFIQLENAVFAKLTVTGSLNPAFFKANTSGVAKDANDYIVYDSDDGVLYYDADGTGAGVKVKFAVIGNHPVLHADDFVVI